MRGRCIFLRLVLFGLISLEWGHLERWNIEPMESPVMRLVGRIYRTMEIFSGSSQDGLAGSHVELMGGY